MPKSITLDKFSKGLNLQQGPSTSSADTLRVLKNAYVTAGKSIRKRPGFKLLLTLEPGTVGLFSGLGKLNTFCSKSSPVVHANSFVKSNALDNFTFGAANSICFCEVFNGFLYVISGSQLNSLFLTNVYHHYLDGAASTVVTDVNCPNTTVAIKISNKIWSRSVDGQTVRYSKTNNPRDWTTANDAGFLPVGVQSTGSAQVTALGHYNGKLVTFFSDTAQVWLVDVDPSKNQLLQTIDIGTSSQYAHANMAGDIFFLSPQGVRTIMAQENTQGNLIDSDVGSPIDRELLAGRIISLVQVGAAPGDVLNISKGQYYRGGGQYWLYRGRQAAVYTFSRSTSISAWSVYEFPFDIEYLDELDGELYARSGDNVYKFDRNEFTDNGTIYPVDIEMAYLDFKSPGMLKQILSMDAVITGNAKISYRYDPRNPNLITSPAVDIVGDSRPGNVFPVEVMATNIAPVIANNDNKDFELHSLQFIYDTLGPM